MSESWVLTKYLKSQFLSYSLGGLELIVLIGSKAYKLKRVLCLTANIPFVLLHLKKSLW